MKNKPKLWRAALMRAVTDANGDPAELDEIARAVVAAGKEAKMDAVREIGERLDGKVPQALVGDDESAPVRFEEVRRLIVDSTDRNSEGVQAPAEPSEI